MCNIEKNLSFVRQQIQTSANSCGRDPTSIKLLAVSKTKSVIQIKQAIQAGQRLFGENYVQEGVDKICYFKTHFPNLQLEWHFIGSLQSNKSRLVAEYFDWMQTLAREQIAIRLNAQRPAHLVPLNILIQVNSNQEATKSGVSPQQVMQLAALVEQLPHLKLRGIMAIPDPKQDTIQQKTTLITLQKLFLVMQQHYPHVDTLSAGMSGDMLIAITHGSTMVRVGTAIFGQRE